MFYPPQSIKVLILVLFFSCGIAQAQALKVDNGDPSGGYGVAIMSGVGLIIQVGDDFEISEPTILEQVEWWGEGDTADISVRIFPILDGVADSAPLIDFDIKDIEIEEVDFGSTPIFHFTAPLPSIELNPGHYLISFVSTDGERFFWSASCEDGCEGFSFRREDETEEWRVGNWGLAFRLYGSSPFLRGDCNADGRINIGDPIWSLLRQFEGVGTTQCEDACDFNDDGSVDITDAVSSLGYQFLGHAPPVDEFCGPDLTRDSLSCEEPLKCEA